MRKEYRTIYKETKQQISAWLAEHKPAHNLRSEKELYSRHYTTIGRLTAALF